MSRLICFLPWSLCLMIADALASIAWIFLPRRRKNLSRDNIMRCLHVDELRAEQISKAAAIQYGQVLIEVLRFPILRSTMKSHVEIEGLHHLTDYIQSSDRNGKGAVIATCHSDGVRSIRDQPGRRGEETKIGRHGSIHQRVSNADRNAHHV